MERVHGRYSQATQLRDATGSLKMFTRILTTVTRRESRPNSSPRDRSDVVRGWVGAWCASDGYSRREEDEEEADAKAEDGVGHIEVVSCGA
jgi:hypothetical protein